MTSIIAESKVGMLGHTASGKTCFMYGMYYAFSIFEAKLPFTLHNQDEREDAMMREIWEQIEDGFRPPGNDVDVITYKFQLRGDLNRPLIDIAWIDYRGGALQAQPTQEEEQELNGMASHGIQRTQVTDTVSMVSSPGDPVPLLVSLKAVDPHRYPFYGEVALQPAGDLRQVLTDSTVVVAEDLLIRLRTQLGASLKIGDSTFRIAAILVREPDRMSSGMGLGPRVMMTQSALEKSGLLQQGSRSGERFLFKLSDANSNIAKVRARLEQILPDAQVTDFRESNPALTDGLKRSTGLLSLICLVAMVLGAIGVAMAMRAHLQQRVEVLAIMKSIGARSFNKSSASSMVTESFPPESATATRSPSRIILKRVTASPTFRSKVFSRSKRPL